MAKRRPGCVNNGMESNYSCHVFAQCEGHDNPRVKTPSLYGALEVFPAQPGINKFNTRAESSNSRPSKMRVTEVCHDLSRY